MVELQAANRMIWLSLLLREQNKTFKMGVKEYDFFLTLFQNRSVVIQLSSVQLSSYPIVLVHVHLFIDDFRLIFFPIKSPQTKKKPGYIFHLFCQRTRQSTSPYSLHNKNE
jgi:hypothetical protein